MAIPLPGTSAYYALPQRQRMAAMQAANAATGGEAAMLLYLTPAEYEYVTASKIPQGAWVDSVKKMYPDIAPYLAVPEIAKVIEFAINSKGNADAMNAALQKTNWWMTRTPSQRSWYLTNIKDPTQALESVRQQSLIIQRRAQTLGVAMSGGQSMILATQGLENGWDNTQYDEHMLQMDTQGYTHGTLGATKDTLRGQADKYVVPISNQGLENWTKNIITGRATNDTFNDYLIHQAKSMYKDPELQKALDEGMTVMDFADPYIQTASQLLGLNPKDIDLSQGRWNRALQFTDPQGKRRAMTMDEWQTNVRMDPIYGYDYSLNGRNEASQLIDSIKQRWGMS